ncbi:Hsp20/alpha crystallin family protein [Pseudomonas benzenivorans]|uniref:Hsp20/alpha crystallin family protein n=1 Tax=Pseudomonas benzenivorans TaxID=556533 RepID=A0ABZ0Q031_9PSED|nr:Hsp20/alpha crystallin family protein [Pseudomonas benzenivorans]WPC06505.1 Hsp20/alpha crystallin family protein [Pseudomonas benzenivorans]
MDRLNELKHGLEETWHSLGEGWRQVLDRASGALTRFTPSGRDKREEIPPPAAGSASAEFPSSSWALLAGDLYEDADKFVVRLEVPGLDKQDLDIEVRGDVLVVRGEKRYEQESSSGHYRIRQCAFGRFHRSIPLPLPVLANKTAAHYRNGVLRIELPKAEHARGRRIEVRTG